MGCGDSQLGYALFPICTSIPMTENNAINQQTRHLQVDFFFKITVSYGYDQRWDAGLSERVDAGESGQQQISKIFLR